MLLKCGVGEDSWESPRTARSSNQCILKEISPEYSLEGLMLKLKLQYFGHLMWRIDSLEKTLVLGRIEGGRRRDDRGWDGWMASPTQWTWVWVNFRSWWWTGRPVPCCSSWGSKKSDTTERLNWTELLQVMTVHGMAKKSGQGLSAYNWELCIGYLVLSSIDHIEQLLLFPPFYRWEH